MLTGSYTLDSSSYTTGFPSIFTFRKQPTNGEDTGTLLYSVVPERRKEKIQVRLI